MHDITELRGVKYFRVHGKDGKIRSVPCHSGTLERIDDYLVHAGHAGDQDGALFRPVKNKNGVLDEAITADGV